MNGGIPQDLKPAKRGGKDALHGLLIDEAEYQFLYRTYLKREALLPQAKKATRKLKQAIKSTLSKLEEQYTIARPLHLKLAREELQILLEITRQQLSAMYKITEEYARRNIVSERRKEAEALLKTLIKLEAKGETVYEAGGHRRGNTNRSVQESGQD